MEKLAFFSGGRPFKQDDLEVAQEGIIDALKGIVDGLGASTAASNFILKNAVITTGMSSVSWTSGYIYYAGEVYPIESGTVSLVAGNQYWQVVEEVLGTEIHQDLSSHDVRIKNKMTLVISLGVPLGLPSVLVSNVPRLNQILGLTPQKGIIMYSGSTTNFDSNGKGLAGTQLDGWALCMTGETEVLLADRTVKTIKEIVDNKLDVEVLSYDIETKQLVPKKIVNWYKATSTEDEFCRIKSEQLGARENHTLTLTKDHPVYTKRGYIKASELKPDDKIFQINSQVSTIVETKYSKHNISELTKQVITNIDYTVRYDIQVEDTHCFFANNVLVHNCNGKIYPIPGFPGSSITSPDLRTRFVVGLDTIAGTPTHTVPDTDYNSIGNIGGEKRHLLTTAELPPHTHPLGSSALLTGVDVASSVNGLGGHIGVKNSGSVNNALSVEFSGTTEYEGADDPHENRPPYYTLAFIIKLL